MATTMSLALLVTDFRIYPRTKVDDFQVARLAQALRAGDTLPPIVAEKSTKRIVDGFHRAQAYQEVYGDTATVTVDLRVYASEDDLLLDAIARNATHGYALNSRDQSRCAIMAQKRSITIPMVAKALHVTEARVQELSVTVAYGPLTGPAAGVGAVPGTNTIVLKRPVRHLEGRELTPAQAEAMPTVPGTSYMLLVRQLLDALRNGFIDLDNEENVTRLRELHAELGRALGALTPA